MGVVALFLELVKPGGEPLLGVQVVVGGAGLEDMEEGQAPVLNSLLDEFLQALHVVGVAPGDPGVARGKGQEQGVEAALGVGLGEAFGLLPQAQGGPGLALGEAVDLVVVEDVEHVHVPAPRGHEVPGPDAQAVPVPAHGHHREVGVGQLGPLGHGEHPAVEGVDPVDVQVVGGLGRAADAREDRRLAGIPLQFKEGHLEGGEDAVVPAPRAPVGLLFRLVVRKLELQHLRLPSSARAFPGPGPPLPPSGPPRPPPG